MIFKRAWAMPNSETFTIPPINDFVCRYTRDKFVIDPFARNSQLAQITNDLNPETNAKFHMDAEEFVKKILSDGIKFDVALFDPPYSPRQISECYQNIGRKATMKDTQNTALYRKVRNYMDELIKPEGFVLSFGWNSNGMGKTRGYKIVELLLVAHGGGHNDTICIAEQKLPRLI